METLRLLVTELVTNSVKHARADNVVLKVLVGPPPFWTEVTDGAGLRPGHDGHPATTRPAGACSWSSVWHTAGAWPKRATTPRSGSSSAGG